VADDRVDHFNHREVKYIEKHMEVIKNEEEWPEEDIGYDEKRKFQCGV
jgi:hypothetical protein